MPKLITRILILLSLYLLPNLVVAMTVQEQIAEIRAMIETETQKNKELKTLLAQKEKEITDLKQNLNNIEVKIASMKQEHNIQ